ncbi:DUF2934 domain-containing protein [Caballeronia sp. SEWSISQ10-4 2]|nr:DUF2934 domain-containing protein [Caballeronia sp. SEWSISQ10-4 2]MDN7184185.1 DUF2934 domain-containing protein [Caballeronia sp. SEWSISQ10-4 2]
MSEEQVFALAFYLWELDGSPAGRSEEYWGTGRRPVLSWVT